jgi:hypothetical protein
VGNLATKGVKDKVEVDTQSMTESAGSAPGTKKVKKTSRVKVKGNPLPGPRDVIIGFKVQQGQSITGFSMDGVAFAEDGAVTRGFAAALASSTGGNEKWVGFKILTNQLPGNLRNFGTTLEIDNFPNTVPYVQAVPIVIAESIAELNAGTYIAAASFVARE